MRKIIVLTIFLSFVFFRTFAQVGDIKNEANKRKKAERSNQNENQTSNNGEIKSGCVDGCMQLLFSAFVQLLKTHHDSLMADRWKDPTVLSFDVMPHFGYSPDKNYADFLGRIRGTWGVLSSDLRINYLTEYINNSADIYKTLEWQVLDLNFMFTDNFNFRIGTGIMYDYYLEKSFNQHFLGIEIRMNEQGILLNGEGRFTNDYNNKEQSNIYNEFNGRLGFRILKAKHAWMYSNFGFLYQKYFDSVELLSLQAGLTINLH